MLKYEVKPYNLTFVTLSFEFRILIQILIQNIGRNEGIHIII
jgi:hypothetical protein